MRVPPNNADAEKSVLGCMMQDRETLSLAFELLSADDFYQPANREIFDAMHALNTQGMPVDMVTVDDELTRRGTLEGVGGSNYLIELSQSMPSMVNARAYVQIVDEKATLRRMIKATSDIAASCYQQTEPVSDILGVAEKSIFDIIMRRHEGSTLTSSCSCTEKNITTPTPRIRISRRSSSPSSVTALWVQSSSRGWDSTRALPASSRAARRSKP